MTKLTIDEFFILRNRVEKCAVLINEALDICAEEVTEILEAKPTSQSRQDSLFKSMIIITASRSKTMGH